MSTTTTPIDTMLAIVHRTYGGPDTVTLETVARPGTEDDEVLVEVHAAGLDRGVVHAMRGTPYVGRLSFGLRTPKRPVLGLDMSGVVVAVGARVSRFQPGDEVYGIAMGSFAEYAAAKESKLVHKPAVLSHVEAAVVPVSGLTALQATRQAVISSGQHVAVLGASGGVGTFLVQTVKAAGAQVTATSSTAKADLVASLGADKVLDRAGGELDRMTGRFDAVLLVAGDQTVSELRRLLTERGRLVVIGEDGGRWLGIGKQIRATLLSPFVSQKLTMLVSRETHVDLEALSAMVEKGTLRPHVGAVYPLARAADAIRHLESGHARGKVAIQVRP